MTYLVSLMVSAEEDLERLFDHLLARELKIDGDLDLPEQAIAAIRASIALLERFPFTCRKSGQDTFTRELVIPFGHTGYVALFEIVSADHVVVSAIRHQREDDYH